MKKAQEILAILAQGTSAIIPEDQLLKKLEKNEPLTIKFGMDPTAPDVHLGHAIVLSKLRQFQDLGHKAVLIIGDFTARIGDPTGKSKTRPPLSEQQIEQNAATYFEQVKKILDPSKLVIHYNSEWLDRVSIKEMVQICAKVTVSRIIEREDFAQRLKTNQPISFHELLYPIFQAYDSVILKADIELGGTDQTFNLLMGRYLQEHFHQEPQVAIITPLLEGLDGGPKMSKSLNNVIGLTEPADQAYGKLMSISDELMWHYAQHLLALSDEQLLQWKAKVKDGSLHPMDAKKMIAHAIVSKFWSAKEADQAQNQFQALFQKKDYSQAEQIALEHGQYNIIELLKALQTCKSNSEAKRLIEGSAVEIDGKIINDFRAQVTINAGIIIRVGKHRIFKIK